MEDYFKEIFDFSAYFEAVNPDSSQLQRTEQWFNQRRGRFTGSSNKLLMSTGTGKFKIEAEFANYVCDFGKGAITYINRKANERLYNKNIRTGSTAAMRWGTEHEEPVNEIVSEWCELHSLTRKNIGFVTVKGADYLGASADGCFYKDGKPFAADETKCPVSWDGMIGREDTSVKGQDFWQMQTEMLALDVDRCFYITAEPPEDMMAEDAGIDCVEIRELKRSELHCKALMARAWIANRAIELWLADVVREKICNGRVVDFTSFSGGKNQKPPIDTYLGQACQEWQPEEDINVLINDSDREKAKPSHIDIYESGGMTIIDDNQTDSECPF